MIKYSWEYLISIIRSLFYTYFAFKGIPTPGTLSRQGLITQGWPPIPYVVEPCDGCPSSTSQKPLSQPCMTSETFLLQVKLLPPPFFRERVSCTPGWTQNVAEDDLGPPEFWGHRYALPCLGLRGARVCTCQARSLPSGLQAAPPALCLFFMISAVCTSPEEITRYVQLFSIPLLPREPEKWEGKANHTQAQCSVAVLNLKISIKSSFLKLS